MITVKRSTRRLMWPYSEEKTLSFPEYAVFLGTLKGLKDREKIEALTRIFLEPTKETGQTVTAFGRRFYFDKQTGDLTGLKDQHD